MEYSTHPCRICGQGLTPILDLGVQKIANYFHPNDGIYIPEAPLVFSRCASCGLAQLEHSVDTDLMYRLYWYTSSMNDTMRRHLLEDAELLMSRCELQAGDQIIDIGCNDGTFLSYFPDHCDKIGIDPSNISPKGCRYIHDYFTYENVKPALSTNKAKVISSIAMFYDLNDPASFVADIRRCLRDDGAWLLELSYLPRMIENTAYDSICHEHVAYYSLTTFMRLLKDTDMRVTDLGFNDINGGSFRLLVRPGAKESPKVTEELERESNMGYGTPAPYDDFKKRVSESRDKIREFLSQCAETGRTVFGYGASTKGQVIMQHCGITSLMAIAERNALKHGLYTPGTNVRICSEESMRAAKPDFLFVFPWYFLDEFLVREKTIRNGGTRIVVPLPKFAVI